MTAVSLGLVAALSLPFLVVLARRPVLRRLALRNAVRRPREAALVVLGSLLGAAIITGSVVVGDTMDASIRQVARTHLGPIDELVLRAGAPTSRRSSRACCVRSSSGNIDGVLALRDDRRRGHRRRARSMCGRAALAGGRASTSRRRARFGGDTDADRDLRRARPRPGTPRSRTDLARALDVGPGRQHRRPRLRATRTVLVVDRILPRRGVAGFWTGPRAGGEQRPRLAARRST